MNAPVKIDGAPAFNAYRAYQDERNYSRKVENLLSRALMLLDTECGRRELRGEDVSHVRAFIKEASA